MINIILEQLVRFHLVKVISETKIRKTKHSVRNITPEEEQIYENIIHDLGCDEYLEKFPSLEHFIVSYNRGLESTTRCICGKPCDIFYADYSYRATCNDPACKSKTIDKTKRERYGQNYEKVVEKTVATHLEKYGVRSAFQSPEAIAKANKTCQERYGVNSPQDITKSEIIKQRVIDTCLEKYGVENVSQLPENREKAKQTCLERYGVEYGSQTSDYREKVAKTSMAKYGVDHPMKCREVVLKANAKYYYDNTCFDSRPELAFYVYHKEYLHENIERCPEKIPYINPYDGVEHDYWPDFRINGQFYEIKGEDQIDPKTNEWIPLKIKEKDKTPEEIESLREQTKAKYYCALKNNVIIYSDQDNQLKAVYIWVRETKGEGFLDSCARNREHS